MSFVFKVKSSDSNKLQLEAADPATTFDTTIVTHVSDIEALQLELELFPLQEGEVISFDTNAHVRILNIAPPPCPVPSKTKVVQ